MSDDELSRMQNEYLRLRSSLIFGGGGDAAGAASEELAVKMQEFCAANGRDLTALGEFLEKADLDIVNSFSPG